MSKMADMAVMVFQTSSGPRCHLMDGDGYKKFAGGLRKYVADVSGVNVAIFYQPGISPVAAKDLVIKEMAPLILARKQTLGL